MSDSRVRERKTKLRPGKVVRHNFNEINFRAYNIRGKIKENLRDFTGILSEQIVFNLTLIFLGDTVQRALHLKFVIIRFNYATLFHIIYTF